jgi:hypothetical protein
MTLTRRTISALWDRRRRRRRRKTWKSHNPE